MSQKLLRQRPSQSHEDFIRSRRFLCRHTGFSVFGWYGSALVPGSVFRARDKSTGFYRRGETEPPASAQSLYLGFKPLLRSLGSRNISGKGPFGERFPECISLRVVNSKDAVHPSSGKVVASSLQKSAGSRDLTVSPAVGVGYGNEGPRQRGGVYTSTGVAVGIGNPGNQSGSTEADRKAMELELSEKGLPAGTTSAPVAGHLYFPIARKKNVRYELEYAVDSEKVVLSLSE